MTRGIQRRQKPVWKKVRKPMPPPAKVQPPKKKGYDHKDKSLQEKE